MTEMSAAGFSALGGAPDPLHSISLALTNTLSGIVTRY